MIKLILGMTIFMSAPMAFAEQWTSFYVEREGVDVSSCSKDKAPSEYMKGYDDMGVSYKVTDEVKDKGGKFLSLIIDKSPGSVSHSQMHFFKDAKTCEAEFKKSWAAKEKKEQDGKKPEDKKYDSYN